ncbi:dethiobiotin synthase [Marinomonas hwangdonensis]|uniref:ATP-dependent dethiobiotin synthetase BioD n=1 Tax=Marinomonas hwangdonensis TaxID=1053647 RepID=A0A3M8QAK9_9GAMM|nr:dethiobiotin synthase [Marinomonas hwangdonensis]MDP5056008.1 dethiobiotin synthase [Marinomonas hwangdonensis]RNF52264.1 dethiobiotin synthase [Marinomonas hwangdonensis]
MKKRFFVTGTDTDAGKTYVTVGLLKAAKRAGLKSFGLKPIAAGAEQIKGDWRNDDALLIQQASSVLLPYEQVNPVVLEAAIAPHIAAMKEGRLITASRLEGFIKGALLVPHDFVLVEGAGGWRVPLNDRELLSDVAKSLGFPVILVVNMKLGCLNHAILTAEAIARDGLTLVGWVANNSAETMPCYDENIATLSAMLTAPLLASIPWCDNESDSQKVFDEMLSAL